MPRTFLLCLIPLLAFSSLSRAEYQRGYIAMMGSSTVVPFAKAAGDHFAKKGRFHEPLIQSSGTGGGLKLFCEGTGPESPDVALASRAIKKRERDECAKNGLSDLIEIKIGYDALILAQSTQSPPWSLTATEVRTAFAKWLAKADGSMVLNPHHTWKDVRSTLPAEPIELLGPPTTSSVHDAFVDLISELECNKAPWIPAGAKESTPDLIHKCRSLREDGVYREGSDQDESHVDLIARSSQVRLGVFGYQMMQSHPKQLRAIPIDGIEPSYLNIAQDRYAGTRPLYLYVKGVALSKVPGLKDFLAEITSDAAAGDQGYLRKAGLITLPETERQQQVQKLRADGVFSAPPMSVSTGSKKAKGAH